MHRNIHICVFHHLIEPEPPSLKLRWRATSPPTCPKPHESLAFSLSLGEDIEQGEDINLQYVGKRRKEKSVKREREKRLKKECVGVQCHGPQIKPKSILHIGWLIG
jgi:hypothetical protein